MKPNRPTLYCKPALRPVRSSQYTCKDKQPIAEEDIPLLPLSDVYIQRRPWYQRRRNKNSLWLIIFAAVLLLLALNARGAVHPTSQLISPSLDEIGAGEFWLRDQQNRRYPAALSQNTQISLRVTGMLAHVRMEQTFSSPGPDWMEGRYLFPLPEKAAVYQFEMRVGERRVKGVIKEKAEAQKTYTLAKAQGKKAALLTQQRPNLFTSEIANIGPGEEVSVVIEYIEQVQFSQGQFSLRLPTTLTPRYMAAATDVRQQGIEQAELNDIGAEPLHLNSQGWSHKENVSTHFVEAGKHYNRLQFSASVDMGMPLAAIESPYHGIRLSRDESLYRVSLASATTPMDRDLVLNWRTTKAAMPKAGFFLESMQNENFALLMLVPPTVEADSDKAIAKSITYIIDTSGSMSGASIRQAKRALLRSLERLSDNDYFNIIEFNSYTRSLFPRALPASALNQHRAKYFVGSLEARGGTEMLPALQRALQSSQTPETDQPLLEQVIFMTDGAVNNEAQLMQEVSDHLGERRLFTVGIGSAPNTHFMRKIAQFGRGTFTYIGDINEVEQRIDALFKQLERPQLRDIRVRWPAHLNIEQYPQRIPDLYAGEPLVLLVKSRTAETGPSAGKGFQGQVEIEGMLAQQPWSQTLQLSNTALDFGHKHSAIASRWAREKIAALLDQQATGASAAAVREAVLRVSLKYQVISPFSSFVAVEEQISRPATAKMGQANVASTTPKGQQSQRAVMAYPQTATGAAGLLLQGGILLLLAGLLGWLLRAQKAASRQEAV